MKMKKLDSFVSSTLGEMVNIISGNGYQPFKGNYKCVCASLIIGQSRSISMATDKAGAAHGNRNRRI